MSTEERPASTDAVVATGGTDGPRGPGATDADAEEADRAEVGLVAVHSRRTDPADLERFAERMAGDVADELDRATAVPWRLSLAHAEPMPERERRYRPSEFVEDALARMNDGPFDLVVVVTDLPVASRRDRIVPGLASPLARVAVVSTHGLAREYRRFDPDAPPALDDPAMRWNGAALVVHLLGHVLGAGHDASAGAAGSTADAAMAPFRFDPDRRSVPRFEADVRRHLERIAGDIPQVEGHRGRLRRAAFHVRSVLRNPGVLLDAVAASRAPLLAFSLPRLSTAGVVPALVLVFSAETWDVGIHLSNAAAVAFAVVSVVAAAVHLLFVQNLSFPRRPSPTVTEHVALVNVAVGLIVLLGMVGLFALVGAVVLVVELLVFPPDLMRNWPSLEDPTVTAADLLRTAGFIATVGTLSGALGGGLEDRAVVRHLALFRDRP